MEPATRCSGPHHEVSRALAGAAVALGLVAASSTTAFAATLEVGPSGAYATPCAAIAAAAAGDTIQVDASGSYDGDTCAWSTDNLTVVGVNGRPKIDLTGVTPAMMKGIFTISATNATIDNFELSGAAIDEGDAAGDNNGAGIRHQGTNLTVKNCYIHDNQDGILGAPATANTGAVTIENTELYNNGAGDGYTHNMYLGDYATVTVQYSYSHHSIVGHLLKSRAYASFILYNRLSDELGGTGSYELDLPNAGTAYVIGNVIEQSAATENPTIVTYGEEGVPTGYDAHLYVVNNTVVNDLMSGTFVNNASSTGALLINNIFYGGGTVDSSSTDTLTTNFSSGNPMFVDEATLDVHLLAGSPCIDEGTVPGKVGAVSLEPAFEYVQPVSGEPRAIVGKAIDIGAYEYGLADAGTTDAGTTDAGTTGDAGGDSPTTGSKDSGTASSDGGTGTSGDSGSTPPGHDAGGGSVAPSSGSSGGCGCSAAGMPNDAGLVIAGCEGLFCLAAFRRRSARRRAALAARKAWRGRGRTLNY
jgi:hypothetical protein